MNKNSEVDGWELLTMANLYIAKNMEPNITFYNYYPLNIYTHNYNLSKYDMTRNISSDNDDNVDNDYNVDNVDNDYNVDNDDNVDNVDNDYNDYNVDNVDNVDNDYNDYNVDNVDNVYNYNGIAEYNEVNYDYDSFSNDCINLNYNSSESESEYSDNGDNGEWINV